MEGTVLEHFNKEQFWKDHNRDVLEGRKHGRTMPVWSKEGTLDIWDSQRFNDSLIATANAVRTLRGHFDDKVYDGFFVFGSWINGTVSVDAENMSDFDVALLTIPGLGNYSFHQVARDICTADGRDELKIVPMIWNVTGSQLRDDLACLANGMLEDHKSPAFILDSLAFGEDLQKLQSNILAYIESSDAETRDRIYASLSVCFDELDRTTRSVGQDDEEVALQTKKYSTIRPLLNIEDMIVRVRQRQAFVASRSRELHLFDMEATTSK